MEKLKEKVIEKLIDAVSVSTGEINITLIDSLSALLSNLHYMLNPINANIGKTS